MQTYRESEVGFCAFYEIYIYRSYRERQTAQAQAGLREKSGRISCVIKTLVYGESDC